MFEKIENAIEKVELWLLSKIIERRISRLEKLEREKKAFKQAVKYLYLKHR